MMGYRERFKIWREKETLGEESNLGRLWDWREGKSSSWVSNLTFLRQWLSESDLISWTMMMLMSLTYKTIDRDSVGDWFSEREEENRKEVEMVMVMVMAGALANNNTPIFLLFLQLPAVTYPGRNDDVFKLYK